MTPERWRKLTDLFHAALARPAAGRSRFLDEASAGDEDLRAEVRAMLAAHENAAGRQDVPAVSMTEDAFELEPGDSVGPYQIRALIGAGGMGRVYRARDSRLDRDVAIKVLPSVYAADTDRLRRFEQEARASSALTHPNVVTVFDVGTDHGRPYLVTELLDGETLRDRLRRGAMPVTRACELAAALARGLAAAHAKGIVHRDLKPENVMITRDGRVKIVDFGVAKLRAQDAGTGPMSATPDVQTESGVVVGTAGYMAPEQIRGLTADARADVFALGAILFELLTGHGAFARPTRADTLEATLSDDPASSESLRRNWPPTLRRIVERCLEKDAEGRFQSAADLAFALETVSGSDASTRDVTRARRWAVTLVPAAALLIAATAGVMTLWRPPPTPSTGDQLARFAIPVGPSIRFTESVAISPDGTTIVYSASEGLIASQQLFVRRIDQITTVALPGTEHGRRQFFSPDGESIAFWADNALKRTRLDGTTPPVVICATESFLGGIWTTEGIIVFGSDSNGLQQVDAAGGMPQPYSTLDPARREVDHHSPSWLPGARGMLLTVHEGERQFRVDVLTPATGARRTVVEDGFDARYISTGHIVYGSGTALFAAPFDLARLERTGPPIQLLDEIETDQRGGYARYDLSDTGTLVFLPLLPQAHRTLAWVNRSGDATPLPLEPRAFWTPRLSPDGRRMAVVIAEQETLQIWIYRFDNGTFSQLTSDGGNWAPVWARDGTHLFHVSQRNGQWQLVRDGLDGRTVPEVLLTTSEELSLGGVSADGRSLVYAKHFPNGTSEALVLDIERRRTATLGPLHDRLVMPVLSPDGRWLGFTSAAPPRPSIFVRRFDEAGPVRQLIEGAGYTVWSRSGDAIYFRSRRGGTEGSAEDGVFELPFDSVRGVATGPERQLFRKAFADWFGIPGFDVAADGRFLMVLTSGESLPRDPNVVLDVDDELRRRTRPSAR